MFSSQDSVTLLLNQGPNVSVADLRDFGIQPYKAFHYQLSPGTDRSFQSLVFSFVVFQE